jgi:hypothetical protein
VKTVQYSRWVGSEARYLSRYQLVKSVTRYKVVQVGPVRSGSGPVR